MKPLLSFFLLVVSFCTATAQQQMELVSQLYYPDGLSSIWGYTAPNGTEYALVGVKSGTSIVDLSNPAQPQEVQFVPGPFNNWRELKTWQHYAYITNEVDEGVLIIDLQNLPATIDTVHFTYNGGIKSAHTVWVDEFGYLYIMGYRNYAGTIPTNERGVLMFDLNPNPMQPVFVGEYTNNYVHDAFVRNNIMYTAEIYAGQFAVVDVSDKQNPVLLATQTTTSAFTHNVWLSDDSQHAFVADEKNDAFLTAYNISDLSDIKETDRYKAAIGTAAMPHNVHVQNDFVVMSYYVEGMKIIDAHQPDALVETEYYDTSPFSGMGSAGCWGVYPYFASGILLGSDRQEGMFITRPTYKRAAYLQGIITNAANGTPIADVTVTINGTSATKQSQFNGNYKTGTANEGTYSISFYKYGYEPLTVDNVVLNTAQITQLDVQLQPATPFSYALTVLDATNGATINNALVEVRNSWASGNNEGVQNQTTNMAGIANSPNLFADNYQIIVHKWGYLPLVLDNQLLNNANSTQTIYLQRGYYDDFYKDLGWTINNTPDVTGAWIRAIPQGTLWGDVACNPAADSPTDFGNWCYVTGNETTNVEDNDLDGGTTQITSPPFNLNGATNATLQFDFWYCNSSPQTGTVRFYLSDGATAYELPSTPLDSLNLGHWSHINLPIALPTATANWQFVVAATSTNNADFIDVAIDKFTIINQPLGTPSVDNQAVVLYAYPNPFDNTITIHTNLKSTISTTKAILYDVLGRQQTEKTLVPGLNTWTWGNELPAGVYVLQIGNSQEGYTITKIAKR